MTPPRRPRRQIRPIRFLLPAVGLVAVLGVWFAVAHASGSGWVQALGGLAAGIGIIGLVGPAVSLRGLEIEVEEAPRDGACGEPFVIVVRSNRNLRCTPSRPAGATCHLPAGAPSPLFIEPGHRGRLSAVIVELSSGAPFGMAWWSVERRLELPTTVTISPHSVSPENDAFLEGEPDGRASRPVEVGEMRGVREYRVGDSPRRVHWRSSAHTGRLMVREDETHVEVPVRVVAELDDDLSRADEQASRLYGEVTALLRHDRSVILETREQGRRVSAAVEDEREAGRRLARAGPNPWEDLYAGSPRSGAGEP